jgi:hypothetical protein
MSLILRGTKGEPLTYDELDGNFIYLDNKPSGTGATGPAGPTGPAGTSTPSQFAALAVVTTQGPFATGGSTKFIKLPFVGTGNINGIMGTASGGDFGASLGLQTHAYQVYASADVEAGNNKTVALRLQLGSGAVLFETECRSRTTSSGTFAKVVTDWIIVPSNLTTDYESVFLTIANMTDAADISIQRCRIVVTDLGLYVP